MSSTESSTKVNPILYAKKLHFDNKNILEECRFRMSTLEHLITANIYG